MDLSSSEWVHMHAHGLHCCAVHVLACKAHSQRSLLNGAWSPPHTCAPARPALTTIPLPAQPGFMHSSWHKRHSRACAMLITHAMHNGVAHYPTCVNLLPPTITWPSRLALAVQMLDEVALSEANGVDADSVARTVLEALTVPKPRSRYNVGNGSGIMLLRRMLPDWAYNSAIKSALKL